MWQRFTERARRVVFFAQEEAGRLGENYVSTEHLLLGLVRENDSVAARILDRMGVSLGRIRSEIERQVTRGDGRLGQDMQLTPRAKRVIDLAYDEARQLSNNYIGSEHLLLGLLREREGLAGQVLAELGVDLERTRREVIATQKNEVGPPERGKRFLEQYKALSPEMQAALSDPGIAFRALPSSMQAAIENLFAQTVSGVSVDMSGSMVRLEINQGRKTTDYVLISTPSVRMTLTEPGK